MKPLETGARDWAAMVGLLVFMGSIKARVPVSWEHQNLKVERMPKVRGSLM